jgi:hypothetical protein
MTAEDSPESQHPFKCSKSIPLQLGCLS